MARFKGEKPPPQGGGGGGGAQSSARGADVQTLLAEVQRLGDRLDSLLAALTGERLKHTVESALSSRLEEATRQASAALAQTVAVQTEAGEAARTRSLESIDHLVRQLREQVASVAALATAADERVAEPRLLGLVQRTVAQHAAELVDAKVGPALKELSAAYDHIDDRIERLRAFLDEFGPGGAPALSQEVEALGEQNARLRSDLEAALEDARTQRKRAEDLDAERLKRRARTGLSVEQLQARIDELDVRDRELADRESLSARCARLESQVEGLQRELNEWRARDGVERQERVDRQRLERAEEELRQADEARERTIAAHRRLERKLSAAEDEVRRMTREREALSADMASRKEREARIEALHEELAGTRRMLEGAQEDLSRVRTDRDDVIAERDRQGDEIARLQERLATGQQEWRASTEAEHRVFLNQRAAELEAWAKDHASNLAAADRVRAEKAAAAVEGLRIELGRAEAARCESDRAARDALAALDGERVRYAALEATMQERRERLEAEADEALQRRTARIEEEAKDIRDAAAREGLTQKQLAIEDADRLTRIADEEERRHRALETDVAELAGRKGVLEAELRLAEQRVEDLRGRVLPRAERIEGLMRPVFDAETLPETHRPDERAWLDGLHTDIRKAGFSFPRRLLEAFHTSLKIAEHAPLVVLAGISGTGKSQLPRLYADLGGLPFLPLAVQPSWDSPYDLFGFFNYTDGRLKAEPLARLLRQVGDPDDRLRMSPSLVLLDEMNLARVEYYFAELLSKLEARRGLPHPPSNEEARRASVEIDVGPGESAIPLFLDARVLFVGTMNEDESTLTLSDKVLDRACVLTFPAPRAMTATTQQPPGRASRRLDWATWRSWIQEGSSDATTAKLNAINEAMELLGRPFGHRLFRAIHAYLANHPEGSDSNAAWSDQFAMKVIPRLRGLECDARDVRDGLDHLDSFVPEDLGASFDRARTAEFFAWTGARDLYRVEG
jgi:hypothetical protein